MQHVTSLVNATIHKVKGRGIILSILMSENGNRMPKHGEIVENTGTHYIVTGVEYSRGISIADRIGLVVRKV